MLKICSKCNQEKECPKNFHKGSKKKDGSHGYTCCKKCYNKHSQKYRLRSGKIKTKPHNIPKENLINKIFGKLTIIEYIGKKQYKYSNKHVWLCKCDCGNIKELVEPDLKNGNVKSCGCLQKRQNKEHPNYKGCEDISGQFWCRIKTSAKRRDLEFNITLEYVWQLFVDQNRKCALSGLNIYFANNFKENGTASLDRIDSKKGYIRGNVQWLHKDINIMKLTHSQDHFVNLCRYIVENNS